MISQVSFHLRMYRHSLPHRPGSSRTKHTTLCGGFELGLITSFSKGTVSQERLPIKLCKIVSLLDWASLIYILALRIHLMIDL